MTPHGFLLLDRGVKLDLRLLDDRLGRDLLREGKHLKLRLDVARWQGQRGERGGGLSSPPSALWSTMEMLKTR